MNYAEIKALEYFLPEKTLDNETLSQGSDKWNPDKIQEKTGVRKRHVAQDHECASDLAFEAASRLFERNDCNRKEIDYVLFCTQSPDYFLPTTACILQDRLGIKRTAGALDFNLGCSGYVYGLSLAKGLIETDQAKNVLLLTAETYTKYLDKKDISTRAIFGDAASATLVGLGSPTKQMIGPFVFGTDGSGYDNLIVKNGCSRNPNAHDKILNMNGPDIFAFTLQAVPAAVISLLQKANIHFDDVDYFIFHQANKFMLTHLRDKINIPENKFHIDMEEYGNTVSSTIPIALKSVFLKKKMEVGSKIMLVGFGVGYSWSACMINI